MNDLLNAPVHPDDIEDDMTVVRLPTTGRIYLTYDEVLKGNLGIQPPLTREQMDDLVRLMDQNYSQPAPDIHSPCCILCGGTQVDGSKFCAVCKQRTGL